MSPNTSDRQITLTYLLPSTPFLLAYALPLLFLSIVLTFAGAFLTLDRTRSFPPSYDTIPGGFDVKKKKKKSFYWLLEGGVGGLAIGYSFGVHLPTFLSLLIPNVSSTPSLGPGSFVPVWLLSALVTTFLAGRWKYAALTFVGITGGSTMALSISVITHPTLLTRVVLTSIFLPLMTMLCLLPLPKIQHGAIRLSASAAGAFGLVLSIALLSHVDAWANVWERLWLQNGVTWGTSKEKGLSVAWCLFLLLGVLVDRELKRRFGENPDEKWDHYLANYAAALPNAANRAGTFKPLSYSFWSRLFGGRKSSEHLLSSDIAFPPDDELKSRPPASVVPPFTKMYNASRVSVTSHPQPKPFNLYNGPAFLRKQGRSSSEARLQARVGKRKERIKFGDAYAEASSDSDSDDDLQGSPWSPSDNMKPWLKQQRSISSNVTGSATLDGDEESGRPRAKDGKDKEDRSAPDYSDYEEDVTAHVERIKRRVSRDRPGWSPDFLKRSTSQNATSPLSNSSSHRTMVSPTPGAVPVPATPSLIKAIDRVALAQKEAFEKSGLPSSDPGDVAADEGMPDAGKEGNPQVKSKAHRWDDFWRDVKAKAGQQ